MICAIQGPVYSRMQRSGFAQNHAFATSVGSYMTILCLCTTSTFVIALDECQKQ